MKLNNTQIKFLFFFFSILLFDSCSRKHFICPAYNSYFIHDQEERESRFSPFIIDSLTNASANQPEFYSQDSSNNDAESKIEATETANGNSKFQPKEKYSKKALPNGLLIASAGKSKAPRATEDIEMKFIKIKPLSRYSNIDSSSLNKSNGKSESVSDSL